MHRWIRRPSALAALLVLLAGLNLAAAPSAAAADVWGVAESSASWTNPATGTVHTFHWRFAVEHENGSPDRFRYRARTWCSYKLRGTSYVNPGRCNFDMFGSILQIKGCPPEFDCMIKEPWGRASWEADNVTEKLWLGGWHNERSDAISYRSVTLHMQARFLAANHLTQVYIGCSRWVYYDGAPTAQMRCEGAS